MREEEIAAAVAPFATPIATLPGADRPPVRRCVLGKRGRLLSRRLPAHQPSAISNWAYRPQMAVEEAGAGR
jgi:hypothetical protein